ncbi:MAG: ATP-binding protein [Candidatus Marinarcus sp.]|uniref:ATP-binding protein n=1 Tax=Candidatus Marinarcus sp. TaxID=3100987 RepID=UPI003AFFD65C
MKKCSLKTRIVLLLIVFAFIIALIIGAISTYSLYTSNLSSVIHKQKIILKQLKSKANLILNKIESTSQYINNEYAQHPNTLKDVVVLNENITSVILLSSDGIIQDFYAQSNLNIYKGFDYSKKEYFQALKHRDYYWSNVFFSTIGESPTITYSAKIGNNQIVVIFINLSDFALFTKNYINSDGSHMVRMFDSQGVMLVNEDNTECVLQGFNALGKSIFVDFISKVEPYKQSYFNLTSNSKKQIGMYATIDKTGWKIVVREDYNQLLDNIWFVIKSIIAVLILFVIIAIFVALSLVNHIFYDIDNLNINAFNIANGEYDEVIKESSYSEFDFLIETFRKMQNEIDKREESLEKSLESFKSLFNSTMEIIVLHKDSVCIDVNDVAVKLLGYETKDELIGKSIFDFISPNSYDIVNRNLHTESELYEIEVLKKDETIMNALIQSKFLEFNGELIKVSAMIDMTALKEKDEILFQQAKMASMGEMIENIAHQWRQPLSTISTAASGIKLKGEYDILSKENYYEFLDSIIHNSQHLSNTIDDFRNFFKKDKNKEPFYIAEVIEKTISLVNASFKNHNIQLIQKIDLTLKIENYKNELIQALINILNNAKDALNLNKIEKKYIEITLCKKAEYAVLTIKDNGGGIDKKILNKIFEPYFTTKHKSQGTGIGLYMTHQIIVNHMQGGIKVENSILEVNQTSYLGCTFTILLKL